MTQGQGRTAAAPQNLLLHWGKVFGERQSQNPMLPSSPMDLIFARDLPKRLGRFGYPFDQTCSAGVNPACAKIPPPAECLCGVIAAPRCGAPVESLAPHLFQEMSVAELDAAVLAHGLDLG